MIYQVIIIIEMNDLSLSAGFHNFLCCKFVVYQGQHWKSKWNLKCYCSLDNFFWLGCFIYIYITKRVKFIYKYKKNNKN